MPNPLLERHPRLRRITNTPILQRGLSTYRHQRLVQERLAFVRGAIRGGTREYRLAADPTLRVVLRHGTRDLEIFDEIFRLPAMYEPPAPPAALLRSIHARRQLRILDLGGNIGLFAVDAFARYPSAAVTSYEPDPANVRVLSRCSTANSSKTWTLVQACATSSNERLRLAAGRFADSYVSDSGLDIPGVDVLPLLHHYDYIKIDIEGSEWPILRDERWAHAMRSVAVVALEWHERGCTARDPRGEAITAVGGAGFTVAASDPGWDHGTIWGWHATS
jgi:FkbM family methyltransferase